MLFTNHKFRIQVTLIITMISIMLLTSVIIIYKTQSDIKEDVLGNNMTLALTLSESFDTYFSELKSSMLVISYSEEISSMDFDRIDPLLQKMVSINPTISQMYVMDEDGMQFYKTSHLDTLGDRSDREYFQKAISGEVFISDVIISRSTGKPIATIAVPIYSGSEIIGVLGASIEFEYIDYIVDKCNYTSKGYVYIVDKYGKVLSHPDEDLVNKMEDLSYLEPVKEVISGNSGVTEYTSDNVKMLIAYVPLDENRWGVLVQVPASEAYAKLYEAVRWIIMIFIASGVLVIIASVIESKKFMNPVNEILHMLNNISNNEYDSKFPNLRSDEFGLIQVAIEKMALEIKDSHNILEEKVLERTKELDEANSSLESYVYELEAMHNQLLDTNGRLTETVSKLNETQDKLVESEKTAALNRLGIRLSHEMNTPLGISITNTSMLILETDSITESLKNDRISKSQLDDYLKLIHNTSEISMRQLDKLADLLKSFNMFSINTSNNRKEDINIFNEIRCAVDNIKSNGNYMNYTIIENFEDELHMHTYEHVITDIITHLLENAIIHGQKKGELLIIDIDVHTKESEHIIIIKDNGAGIDKEHVSKVFEPFYKDEMSKQGYGMGLSVILNMVDILLGGSIACESEKDSGTIFTITVPIADKIRRE